MKKEYIIIGAVVLTIGYFVWINNQKKIANGNTGDTPNGTNETWKGCPKGYKEQQVTCITTPCNPMCVPI